MERARLLITVRAQDPGKGLLLLSPALADQLESGGGYGAHQLRFGSRLTAVQVGIDPQLPPGEVRITPDLAHGLGLDLPRSLSLWAESDSRLALGPLVGLLISHSKLDAILAGKRDTVYCRYARYASEVGAMLVFFAAGCLDMRSGLVYGYCHTGDNRDGCHWEPVVTPVPRVIYDRCFGKEGREEAARVRAAVHPKGWRVLNHLPKITKLEAFAALEAEPKLRPYLPVTKPLTPENLAEALASQSDIYLKPDALYKGKGIFRLTREPGTEAAVANAGAGADAAGPAEPWRLSWRAEEGNRSVLLPSRAAATAAVAERVPKGDVYLLQEGLTLATYLGNRFDFRSLVQRSGSGGWMVTGLVARVAPQGSVITSPRSGGQVVAAEEALRQAFPEKWADILTQMHRVSLLLARRIDVALGPCLDLGLDMAVLADGSVRLIEVNGKPLRVSLERLNDPLIRDRINRWPIHYAAYLEAGRRPATVPAAGDRPLTGVFLDTEGMRLLQGARAERYRQMSRSASEAGCDLVFFDREGMDVGQGQVVGLLEHKGAWKKVRRPVPAVIYNRATYSSLAVRKQIRADLKALRRLYGTLLLNQVNAAGKLAVCEALSFFADSAPLVPETVLLTGPELVESMLARHASLFLKADFGSHGSDVLRARKEGDTWEVRGRFDGREVLERMDQAALIRYLHLLGQSKRCILQQGIAVAEADGRVLDVRAIAQKDGQGQWQVPAVIVRQAPVGGVASNMALGGEGMLPEAFLARYGTQFPALRNLRERAAAVAVLAAKVLESRFGRLGEVGIDIAVETGGRAWVLEMNTKPMHPQVGGLDDALIRLPFHYAAYLTGRGRQALETE